MKEQGELSMTVLGRSSRGSVKCVNQLEMNQKKNIEWRKDLNKEGVVLKPNRSFHYYFPSIGTEKFLNQANLSIFWKPIW